MIDTPSLLTPRNRDMQVYAELQSRLDARVLEETTAVETAMAMARDAVDRQSFIEHDWQLQVRVRARVSVQHRSTTYHAITVLHLVYLVSVFVRALTFQLQ